jgi:hypothetical protein
MADITDVQIWKVIAGWDEMTEGGREWYRIEYPQVKWDLTVDWTRVGDDLRRSLGLPVVIRPVPLKLSWFDRLLGGLGRLPGRR